jgi:KUP system potassium uptake protein
VLAFRTSGALAAAYGIAVTGTMAITSICYYVVVTGRWGWSRWKAGPLVGLFLLFDGSFFVANSAKILEGGWFPLAMGLVVFTVMVTWKSGRRALGLIMKEAMFPLADFLADMDVQKPVRVPGTAVFMTPSNDYLPPALLHNLKHNMVLHERNVLLSVETLAVPRAEVSERLAYTDLGHGFARLSLRFGYMEDPDVPKALRHWSIPGPALDPMRTTFFASRESLTARKGEGMAQWRDKLFLYMSRNATPATEFFSIPGNRLVELGTQVAI